MSFADQFLTAIKSLGRLNEELPESERVDLPNLPAIPSLSEIIQETALPSQALLFGLASDGMPVLLSLVNPKPGPVLILGDAGSGKTNFLRTVAQSVAWMHAPESVRFNVISATPEGWQGWDVIPNFAGVCSTHEHAASDLLFDLTEWAQQNQGDQTSLLLIDDLMAFTTLDANAQENLKWILTNGPAHRLWPLVTLNSYLALDIQPWVSLFRTRIYGAIQDPLISGAVTPIPGAALTTLLPGAQFTMRSRSQWLRFWLPTMD